MEIFNPVVRPGSNIQVNNYATRVNFGQYGQNDSFTINSPIALFNENEIKKMISQNPEIKKILNENKIPLRLNMSELQDLKSNHCADTQEIASNIVKYLLPALKQQINIKDLKEGALLHDFGKVLIPPEILNKNGTLTPEEHKIMDLHSELGYQLLKNSGVNEEVLKLVRYHHGNYNGVPDLNLQILSLADKYSALTEKRVYKEAFTPQKALAILYKEVQNGEIHPFIFNALVQSVNSQGSQAIVNKY
ncbi:HD domain-containing protein [bacterium]|nr:HD domain-containing protein [bacterium]